MHQSYKEKEEQKSFASVLMKSRHRRWAIIQGQTMCNDKSLTMNKVSPSDSKCGVLEKGNLCILHHLESCSWVKLQEQEIDLQSVIL